MAESWQNFSECFPIRIEWATLVGLDIQQITGANNKVGIFVFMQLQLSGPTKPKTFYVHPIFNRFVFIINVLDY